VPLLLCVGEEPAFGDRGRDDCGEDDILTRSENWVLSMIPAFSPKSAEIVPKVSPVLMRRVRR
jgi:hypothetical protein